MIPGGAGLQPYAQHGTIRGYHKYMMDIFMVQQQITGK